MNHLGNGQLFIKSKLLSIVRRKCKGSNILKYLIFLGFCLLKLAETKSFEPIRIKVPSPSGPPPIGAVVETSVPFSCGKIHEITNLTVTTSTGEPVLTQFRVVQRWLDGSIKWLHLLFEAEKGPGDYFLKEGKAKTAPNLLNKINNEIIVDTGEISIFFNQNHGTLVKEITALGKDRKKVVLISESPGIDLVIKRYDGKQFKASLDNSRRVIIEEIGPIRASLRYEGKLFSEDGESLFSYIWRWQAYRSRSEIITTLTWINTEDSEGVFLKDIRIVLPFKFLPNRLVFGCERGVYDGPFLKDWPVFILQEDHNQYWALTKNPDGRIQHLCSGGCDGEHFPGWVYLQNSNCLLGVWVPNFWQEYPNEIEIKEGEISIGLWPERANEYLSSKRILPADIDGKRYHRLRYWPVMPHPYIAFFDKEKKCLDVPQGLAKTQEVVISFWAGRDSKPIFEKKLWNGSLTPVRAHIDPIQVAKSQVCGPLWPYDPENFPDAERIFDECFNWFQRHIETFKCYGKFDYGDFRYFIPSTTYMCHPGTKWGHMGEMPREGYWNNNERDVLRGILLYYLRTGNSEAWELCRIISKHILDVDIRHYPDYGMYTHSYGHFYLGANIYGKPDHSWLMGLLEWAGVSGDPIAWEWVLKCGERLASTKRNFSSTDCRNAAMQLHMMTQFYRYTGEKKYIELAQQIVETFIKLQKPDGSWPGFFNKPEGPPHPTFTEHAIMALGDYFDLTKDEKILPVLKKALAWVFPDNGKGVKDIDAIGLALYGLAIVGEYTGEPIFSEIALNVFQILDKKQNRSQDPICRGDWYPIYEIHNKEQAEDSGRPPQFCNQSRPLIPATVLAYSSRCLWFLAKYKGLILP